MASFFLQDTLTQEFANCSKKMIELVNAGRINMRTRGSKKTAIENILKGVRTTTVENIRRKGVTVKERFKAVTMERWAELHPGKIQTEIFLQIMCAHHIR